MEKIIGYCGIICSECPVFITIEKNDDAEGKQVAEIFTKQYGKDTLDEIRLVLGFIWEAKSY